MLYRFDNSWLRSRMNYLFMPWGRVGSNLVLDILAQSPDAGCVVPEPLTRIRTKTRGETLDFLRQLRWLASHRATISASMMSLAYPAILMRVMRGRAVYLDRRNTVKTAISAIRAKQYSRHYEIIHGTSVWAVRPGFEMPLRPEIDPKELMCSVRAIESGRKRMSLMRKQIEGPLVWYEDLTADLDGVMRTIWTAFGLAPYRYEVRSVKATSDNLRDAVANFDALADVLPAQYAAQLR